MRLRTATKRAAWIVAVLAAGALHLQAGSIVPDAFYNLDYLYGSWSAPGTYQGPNDGFGGFTLAATTNPQVSFNLDPRFPETVDSKMQFSFEVTGPVGQTVSISFYPNLQYFAATPGNGSASFFVGGSPLPEDKILRAVADDNLFPNFSGVMTADFMTNTVYPVGIAVGGYGDNWDNFGNPSPFATGSSSGSASVYLRADLGSDYALVLSDGILNAPPSSTAPEPASCLLVGLAMCGVALLKRRATSGRARA
jgi:hypothetical protein